MKKFLLLLVLFISTQIFAEFASDTANTPKGSTVTLTWSSSADSCTASDSWSGSKSGSGTEEVTLPAEGWNLFSLNCGSLWEYLWVWGSAEVVQSSNSAPTLSGLPSSISVAENQTSVTTVTALDSDGDALTYSLSGYDAASFNISSVGVLSFNSAPDYETKTSYSVTVNVSDGTNTTSHTFTVNITDVDESDASSGSGSSSGSSSLSTCSSGPSSSLSNYSYSSKAQNLIDQGWNQPSPCSTFLFASDIDQNTRTKIEDLSKEITDILGDYPFTFYGTSTDDTLNQPLRDDLCQKMNYSDCSSDNSFFLSLLDDETIRTALVSTSTKQRFIIAAMNRNTNSSQATQDTFKFLGLEAALSWAYLKTLLLGRGGGAYGGLTNTDIVPQWFFYGFSKFFSGVHQGAKGNLLGWPSLLELWKGQEGFNEGRSLQEMETNYPSGGEIHVSTAAVAYMVSRSSVQKVYVDFLRDLPLKDWKQSFEDNIGLSLEQFYSDFSDFLNKSTQDQQNILFPSGLWNLAEEIDESSYIVPSEGYSIPDQNLIDIGWNRSSSPSIMVAKDIDQRYKGTIKSIYRGVADIIGNYPLYYYGASSDTTFNQPLIDDACSKLQLTDCSSETGFLSYFNGSTLASTRNINVSPSTRVIIGAVNKDTLYEAEITGTADWSSSDRYEPIFLYLQSYLRTALLDKNVYWTNIPAWVWRGLPYFFAIRYIEEEINPTDSNAINFLWDAYKNADESMTLSLMEDLENWPSDSWAGGAFSALAVEYMIHRSSAQKVYIDFIREIYSKGWEQSFQDNIGLSVEQFYEDFQEFISVSAASELVNVVYPNNNFWKLKDQINPYGNVTDNSDSTITIPGSSSSANENEETPTSVDNFKSGVSLQIQDITTASQDEEYVGFVMAINESTGQIFTSKVEFALKQYNANNAYFTKAKLVELHEAIDLDSSQLIVQNHEPGLRTSSWHSAYNSIKVKDASNRYVEISLDLLDETYTDDLELTGIFSEDFSTLVGGNGTNSIFVAQKKSLETTGISSKNAMNGSWYGPEFSVDNYGNILIQSIDAIQVGGIGGSGYIAYKGTTDDGVYFDGETALHNSKTNAFAFGRGAGIENTTPVATSLDGVFILAPDKKFVGGYDSVSDRYFAFSKQSVTASSSSNTGIGSGTSSGTSSGSTTYTALAKSLINQGWNSNTETKSTYQIAEDLDTDWLNTAEQLIDGMAAILGNYNFHYYGLGGSEEANLPLIEAACSVLNKIDCTKESGQLQAMWDISTGSQFNLDPFNSTRIIYQDLSQYLLEDRYMDRFNLVWRYFTLTQASILLDKVFDQDVFPNWTLNGMALLFSALYFEEQGDEIGPALAFNRIIELYENDLSQNPDIAIYESYDSENESNLWMSHLAVTYMVSLSSMQKVFVDFPRDVYAKGWRQSFEDNIGLSVEEFYTQFDSFLALETSEQLEIYPSGVLSDLIDINAESPGSEGSSGSGSSSGTSTDLAVLNSDAPLEVSGGQAPTDPSPWAFLFPTPTLSFDSSSLTVNAGETFTLTWSTVSANSCTASGAWSGYIPTSGNLDLTSNDQGSYEFNLECTGMGGSVNSTLTVEILASQTQPQPSGNFSISGTVNASGFLIMDGDVPSDGYPEVNNNNEPTFGYQELINPTQVIGYAKYDPESEDNDEIDIYKIASVGDQFAFLEISDWQEENPSLTDLEIYIYDEEGNIEDYSISNTSTEVLPLKQGNYYVAIVSEQGASKYVLSIGTVLGGYEISNFSSLTPIENNEFLIIPNKQKRANQVRLSSSITKKMMRQFMLNMPPGDDRGEVAYLQKFNPLEQLKLLGYQGRLLVKPNPLESGYFTESMQNEILTKKLASILHAEDEEFSVELNMKFELYGAFQADPDFNKQWDHKMIATDRAIDLVGSSSNSQIVAVLDTGAPESNSLNYSRIDYTGIGYDARNQELGGTAIYSNPDDQRWVDYDSHGTHVAGTIAAKNDGKDLNGMGVKVLPIRVGGSGDGMTSQAILDGINYAIGEPNESGTLNTDLPVAINMSFGACGDPSPAMCSAVESAINRGISVVVSAGNCTCNKVYSQGNCPRPNYWTKCPGVIGVGAVDAKRERANYSTYNEYVDIAAPGGDIYSYITGPGNDGVLSFIDRNKMKRFQGTSMAAPHVAGAIALMHTANPNLNAIDVNNILRSGGMTEDIDESGRDDKTGYGLLNVAKAVQSAAEYGSSGSSNLSTTAVANPSQLDFAFTRNLMQINLEKYGDAELQVDSITAHYAEYLSYSSPSDGDDFGTYTLYLDRTDLPQGSFTDYLYFNLSNGDRVSAFITYSKGELRSDPDIGLVWIVLLDSETEEVANVVPVNVSNGDASFAFEDLPAGLYELYALTDIDDNSKFIEIGELFDYLPKRGNGFPLDQDISEVELFLSPFTTISLSSFDDRHKAKVLKPLSLDQ